mmetsp:Transcript_38780/g.98361  ORF Transcript_38780/g.98361 Transcript_38780/m.98361 type:complete len:202 (+) Transcript_38780:219-824(+)
MVQPRVGGAAHRARRARGVAAGHGAASAARHPAADRGQLAHARGGRRDGGGAEPRPPRAVAPAVRAAAHAARPDRVARLLQATHGAAARHRGLPPPAALAPPRPLPHQAPRRRPQPRVPSHRAQRTAAAARLHPARLHPALRGAATAARRVPALARAQPALLLLHAARRHARQAPRLRHLPRGTPLPQARGAAARGAGPPL